MGESAEKESIGRMGVGDGEVELYGDGSDRVYVLADGGFRRVSPGSLSAAVSAGMVSFGGEAARKPRSRAVDAAVAAGLASVATLLLVGAFWVLGQVGGPAETPPAPKPLAPLSVAAVQDLIESRDATGYAGMVDVGSFSAVVQSETVSAYLSYAKPAASAAMDASAAIASEFTGYESNVAESVATGVSSESVPMHGLESGQAVRVGDLVTVSVTPPGGSSVVTYVFDLSGGRYRLVSAAGLAPYVLPAAISIVHSATGSAVATGAAPAGRD